MHGIQINRCERRPRLQGPGSQSGLRCAGVAAVLGTGRGRCTGFGPRAWRGMARPAQLLAFCAAVGVACAAAPPRQDAAGEAPRAEQPAGSMSVEELMKLADKAEKGVEEIRGWKFKRPVKRKVYTEDELRAWLEKKLFEQELPEPLLRRIQAFLRMTGIIPADCDIRKTYMDVLLNQIGGFYDPETDTFYMLNRQGVDYGPVMNGMMIAHELTHALDDQYVDLHKMIEQTPKTEDAQFAVAAVVEGSATVIGLRYMMRDMASGEYDMTQLQKVQEQELERSKVFLESPRYFTTLVANYLCGMFFYGPQGMGGMAGMGAGGQQDEDATGDKLLKLAKNPPKSSEQILHPEKYWDDAQRDEPVVVNDEQAEKLIHLPGYRVVHRNTAGELLCAVLTTPPAEQLNLMAMGLPTYWTNDDAAGWGGDRFYLLAKGGSEQDADKLNDLKGVWITLWDTRTDRNDFMAAYRDREVPGRQARRLGERGALFLFGFDEDAAQALFEKIEANPPKFTKGGEDWKLDAD